MQKWNKTTITWPMWATQSYGHVYPADGPKTNLVSPAGSGTQYYTCREIIAESQRSRALKLSVALWASRDYRNYVPGPEEWLAARRRLHPLVRAIGGLVSDDYGDSRYGYGAVVLDVPLRAKESFCERAIELVGDVIVLLDISDDEKRIHGNFFITQTTYVKTGERWEPYADLLRFQLVTKFGLKGPYIYYDTN